ncbi:MAG: glucose-6-phosphate dehydrogenase [Holophagaceae bacterium]|nr:glucose-6-phosphate dehydrogenase [Holophagaceae bacterium]
MAALPDFDIVLFGGSGDLAMRKLLPALYHLFREGMLAPGARIMSSARKNMSLAEYRASARTQCGAFLGQAFDAVKWESFSERLFYFPLDAQDSDSYHSLKAALNEHAERIRVFYFSTPPSLFPVICSNLGRHELITPESRVVLEKPLGHDLKSSCEINDLVGGYFSETQIFRIDHYLGKESVQNLLALRFGNALFEPLWRREWIRDVQITVAEQLGVEGRGEFYDRTGALRDMVQNHLLQLLCIVAMEPPSSIDPNAIRDEKLKVLRSLRPFTAEDVATKSVRGQYRSGAINHAPVGSYTDEPGINAESSTETFVALKAEIDTWRWAGVPFFLRSGKRMPERVAEIIVNFREVPHSIFDLPSNSFRANQLVIRMQPEESMKLFLLAKKPGDTMALEQAHLNLDFAGTSQTRRLDAYERLLMDAIRGNLTLFVRRDEQEAAWTWVEPILSAWSASPERPKLYAAGTWGPAASTVLASRDGLAWNEES